MVKKNQLAQTLGEKFGVSKKQATEWLDVLFDEITKVIKGGDKVNIAGFGIFRVAIISAADKQEEGCPLPAEVVISIESLLKMFAMSLSWLTVAI